MQTGVLELEVFEFCADTDSNERLFVRLSYDSHPRGGPSFTHKTM